MSTDEPIFVSFEPHKGHFIGAMSMQAALSDDIRPEALLAAAAQLYEHRVMRMQSLVSHVEKLRSHRQLTPARLIWQLGDEVFALKGDLASMSVQINGVYEHLVRDLGVKRKWLEKVIILRRYVADQTRIPEPLNWGQCEKGTRRMAERLNQGLPLC